ncbi:MAG: metallophosphoesterase [Deltaproteobacteria bacterium]|nr:metallophosphoesterase [Deltaproteobacteria bacterium]
MVPLPPNGLNIAYWEIADRQTSLLGLGASLDAAGWRSQALPLDKPPESIGVDVIVFGSFVTEDPRYAPYMAEQTPSLRRFVDSGGTILQFTQARGAEPQPPFLLSGLSAARTDTDIAEVFAVDPNHPLMEGLGAAGRDDNLIDLPSPTPPSGIAARPGCWDCFHDQVGFKVIAAGRRDGEFPALLEAASSNGLGRILISSLHLDKVRNAAGGVVVEAQVVSSSAKFFNNLTRYVKLLKGAQLPLPTVTPTYVAPAPATPQPGSTSIVVFPDTQNYSFPMAGFDSAAVFRSQTTWANVNLKQLNTAFMLNLGDIVEHNVASEWNLAVSAYGILPAQQPLLLSTGNHDHGPNGSGGIRSTPFDQYFPTQRFRAMSTFGGALETAENSYHLVDINGETWIVLGLEWAPRNSTLEWAKGVLNSHSNLRAIIATHAYMFNDETRYDYKSRSASQPWNPHWYFGANPEGATVNDGQEIWEKLVSVTPNIRLVLSGHVGKDGIGRMASLNNAGQVVHQLAFNYQDYPLGGGGYLRIFEFLNDKRTVRVRTYSPFLDRYMTDAQNQFDLAIAP